jgi:hypothetical protein
MAVGYKNTLKPRVVKTDLFISDSFWGILYDVGGPIALKQFQLVFCHICVHHVPTHVNMYIISTLDLPLHATLCHTATF